MKLGGAALVASALGLVGAGDAQGEELRAERIRRRRCNRHGGDFCNNSGEAGFPFVNHCQRQEEASQGVLRFSRV
jgi:hypothetical protein